MAPGSAQLSSQDFADWWRSTGEYELHQVLYWRWDPIGVANGYPRNADEYDQYPAQIVAALRTGASDDELVTLLRGFEQDNMGLPARDSGERLSEVVAVIRAWFQQSVSSWREFGPLRR